MLMDEKSYLIMQELFAENHASEKQCSKCIYYVEKYYDDFTVKNYGWGEIKIRPACSCCNNYGFVSHNPARSCRHYEVKQEEIK